MKNLLIPKHQVMIKKIIINKLNKIKINRKLINLYYQ